MLSQLWNRHARAIVAGGVLAVSAAIALAYSAGHGTGNQLTYLLAPLRRAHPELLGRDWLVASTTQYHPVFAWLTAPLYKLDRGGVIAFGVAQLAVMTATLAVLYRLIAALARRGRLAMFVLLVGVLALGGGRAMAGSYLFAGYLQPSSLATLAWLIALVGWLRGQPMIAGVALAVGGACHVNFLVLGIGLFAAIELTAQPVDPARLAAVVGPSLLVLAAFLPGVLAHGVAHEPDAALRVLVKFHAPGHYDPARLWPWLPPLIAWLVIAWAALPLARYSRPEVVERLWRFAAMATALCVAATAIAAIPPWLGITRLFVWRIAPFAQLASQLIAIVAAFAPIGACADRHRPGARYAVPAAALVLLAGASHLMHGDDAYAIALGAMAAAALAMRGLGRRAPAVALAVATCALALAHRRDALVDPPVFQAACAGPDCELLRWAASTPVDAVFLVPPYMAGFRLYAERAVVADSKSPPLYPDELVAWYRRLCAMVDAPDLPTHEAVEARWDALTAAQVMAAARRFRVDYVVIDKQRSVARLAAPVAYETPERVVYRIAR